MEGDVVNVITVITALLAGRPAKLYHKHFTARSSWTGTLFPYLT